MSDLDLPPIEACIPHRGAMRLVHRLVHADEASVRVEVDIDADSPFAREDGVPAWVGIEYMAQTIAAWAGVKALRVKQRPRIGFLLGTRRYESSADVFPIGACLLIEARCELLGNNGLGQFFCQIFKDNSQLAQASITVYEPENVQEALQETF